MIRAARHRACLSTLMSLKEFQERNSGWALLYILNLTINVNKLNFMRAGYHIEVPRQITMKRKSGDQCAYDGQCVLCVVGDRRSIPGWKKWESSYPHYTIVLNLAGIEFPVTLKDISRFNCLNVVSINVHGIKNKQVLPLRLISDKKEKHINVL